MRVIYGSLSRHIIFTMTLIFVGAFAAYDLVTFAISVNNNIEMRHSGFLIPTTIHDVH